MKISSTPNNFSRKHENCYLPGSMNHYHITYSILLKPDSLICLIKLNWRAINLILCLDHATQTLFKGGLIFSIYYG